MNLKLVLCIKGRTEAERVGEERTEDTGSEGRELREHGEDCIVRSFTTFTPLQVL